MLLRLPRRRHLAEAFRPQWVAQAYTPEGHRITNAQKDLSPEGWSSLSDAVRNGPEDLSPRFWGRLSAAWCVRSRNNWTAFLNASVHYELVRDGQVVPLSEVFG